MVWGFHLLLDCRAGEIALVNSRENILKFIKDLVMAIDMKPYGEPWVERFATHDASKSGFSFCQMIETSNITGHFVEADGNFYIDIFSCKPYSYNLAVAIVKKFFNPQEITQQIILRDASISHTPLENIFAAPPTHQEGGVIEIDAVEGVVGSGGDCV